MGPDQATGAAGAAKAQQKRLIGLIRAARESRKIVEKLGGDTYGHFYPDKSKGMRHKTFDQLRQQEKATNHASMMALAKQVGILEFKRFGML